MFTTFTTCLKSLFMFSRVSTGNQYYVSVNGFRHTGAIQITHCCVQIRTTPFQTMTSGRERAGIVNIGWSNVVAVES